MQQLGPLTLQPGVIAGVLHFGQHSDSLFEVSATQELSNHLGTDYEIKLVAQLKMQVLLLAVSDAQFKHLGQPAVLVTLSHQVADPQFAEHLEMLCFAAFVAFLADFGFPKQSKPHWCFFRVLQSEKVLLVMFLGVDLRVEST